MTVRRPQDAFASTGTLRAAINLGNPVLASRGPAGDPVGVSVDLAREFARRLGARIELVAFDKAAASVAAVREERADIGFFAIDPARADGLLFTAPYLLIEGSYAVPQASTTAQNAQVDAPGRRVSVATGSAYDLYLSRTVERAELVRFDGYEKAFAALRAGEVDVSAGIRQVLEREAAREPGLRLLDGRFMVIQQAMGVPAGRGTEAQKALAAFVEDVKAGGFVADALQRHGVDGATVAPAGRPGQLL